MLDIYAAFYLLTSPGYLFKKVLDISTMAPTKLNRMRRQCLHFDVSLYKFLLFLILCTSLFHESCTGNALLIPSVQL